jgi:hypothetical protein
MPEQRPQRDIQPPMTLPERSRSRENVPQIQYRRGLHPNDASNRLPENLRVLDPGLRMRGMRGKGRR